MELRVVKPPEANKGFVLLPRRWVVERSFGWLAPIPAPVTRLAKRMPHVLVALPLLDFVALMLPQGCAAVGGRQ